MFSMFDGKGKPGANCPSHDDARQEADGSGTHQHRGPFPGISRGIAVRRYVRGQRLPPPSSIRHPRQQYGRHPTDMGVPRAFRSDNGAEYTNHSFVEYCNNLGIRRELTAPYTSQQNSPAESALWRAYNAGHTARLGVSNIYRTSVWKRSGALRTRQQRFCGRSHYFGPRSASIGRLPRQMTDGSPPMRSSMGPVRRCRYCHFPAGLPSSAPTMQEWFPSPPTLFLKLWL